MHAMLSHFSTTEPREALDQQIEVRALLRQVANGDRPAFRELHHRFSGLIYATAVQVLHNHEDAEDTVQEVFAQVWNKANMFCDERGKPSTWLTTLTRNKAIDKLRSRERRSRLYDGYEDEMKADRASISSSPSKEATVRELAGQARNAVLQLSSEQRQAIQLAFFDGLTQLEISQRTGEPLGTIKARIRRGLGKLRGMIRE